MTVECPREPAANELGVHSYLAGWCVEGIDHLYREFGLATPNGYRNPCSE